MKRELYPAPEKKDGGMEKNTEKTGYFGMRIGAVKPAARQEKPKPEQELALFRRSLRRDRQLLASFARYMPEIAEQHQIRQNWNQYVQELHGFEKLLRELMGSLQIFAGFRTPEACRQHWEVLLNEREKLEILVEKYTQDGKSVPAAICKTRETVDAGEVEELYQAMLAAVCIFYGRTRSRSEDDAWICDSLTKLQAVTGEKEDMLQWIREVEERMQERCTAAREETERLGRLLAANREYALACRAAVTAVFPQMQALLALPEDAAPEAASGICRKLYDALAGEKAEDIWIRWADYEDAPRFLRGRFALGEISYPAVCLCTREGGKTVWKELLRGVTDRREKDG